GPGPARPRRRRPDPSPSHRHLRAAVVYKPTTPDGPSSRAGPKVTLWGPEADRSGRVDGFSPSGLPALVRHPSDGDDEVDRSCQGGAMAAFVMPFEGLGREDVDVAGGKGANLGEMTRAGLPVPPGFVVTAEAFLASMDLGGVRAELQEVAARGATRGRTPRPSPRPRPGCGPSCTRPVSPPR